MSETFRRVIELIERQEVVISEHAEERLDDHSITMEDIESEVTQAIVVEDYPEYHAGPSVLVLQRDLQGQPIHVVWGIPNQRTFPAVLVTAYRPDPDRWEDDFLRRKA